MSYREQRDDPQWIAKSDQIKADSDYKCVKCGSRKKLTTHHGYYHPGKQVWEYDDATLWCLCWSCHTALQPILTAIHLRIATINPKYYAKLLATVKKHTVKFSPAMTELGIVALIAEINEVETLRFAAYSVQLRQNTKLGPSMASVVELQAQERFPGLTIDIMSASSDNDCTAYVTGPDGKKKKKIQKWFDRRQEGI